MASHAQKVRDPGSYKISSGLKSAFIALVLLGVVTFLYGLKVDAERAWSSFVINHFYFMSLALGGAFFAAIQWVTGAMWSAPVRRLAEAFTAYLPVSIVTFVILYFGIHHLYIWSHPQFVKGDQVLEGKASYLNISFFMARNILALIFWYAFAGKMVCNSIKQDESGDFAYTLKNRVLSPIFLLVFALTFTMASFDQLMSLDPHWFSTIFGIYCFAGLVYSTFAALCIITYLLRNKLRGIVNTNHFHDIGKFMFAFTVFWAYIGFSQYMLIWYANLPEETGYFIKRFHEKWFYVSAFLLVGKFLTPFFILLPRDAKRNADLLFKVAVFMLIAQWIDMMWIVQPEFYIHGPRVGLIEILMTAGFVGMFGLAVSRFLSRHNIVAIGDPRLAESVYKHHQ
ncbi:MAG: molybdopterin oxidoreductase [Bdellovibrionota bacterium]